ncbi:MAG: hypothetical protein KDA65_09210 [Planctomycetaceae bacterium]|nr:hypothetical protein [Planctomycetaceae bacterium]
MTRAKKEPKPAATGEGSDVPNDHSKTGKETRLMIPKRKTKREISFELVNKISLNAHRTEVARIVADHLEGIGSVGWYALPVGIRRAVVDEYQRAVWRMHDSVRKLTARLRDAINGREGEEARIEAQELIKVAKEERDRLDESLAKLKGTECVQSNETTDEMVDRVMGELRERERKLERILGSPVPNTTEETRKAFAFLVEEHRRTTEVVSLSAKVLNPERTPQDDRAYLALMTLARKIERKVMEFLAVRPLAELVGGEIEAYPFAGPNIRTRSEVA